MNWDAAGAIGEVVDAAVGEANSRLPLKIDPDQVDLEK